MLRIALPKQKYKARIFLCSFCSTNVWGRFKAPNTSDGIVHVNIQVNFSRRANVKFIK